MLPTSATGIPPPRARANSQTERSATARVSSWEIRGFEKVRQKLRESSATAVSSNWGSFGSLTTKERALLPLRDSVGDLMSPLLLPITLATADALVDRPVTGPSRQPG